MHQIMAYQDDPISYHFFILYVIKINNSQLQVVLRFLFVSKKIINFNFINNKFDMNLFFYFLNNILLLKKIQACANNTEPE